MRRAIYASLSMILFPSLALAEAQKPMLVREPTVSNTQIVFSFAGDLWIVGRDGGEAKRLTSGVGIETHPKFSPDGRWVAFTGEYAGNPDVYVVSADGGVPRQLTYHPGADEVVGWTSDGRSILFRSPRASFTFSDTRLYTVSLDGGYPTEVPLARAREGSFSSDGSHLAYVPNARWQAAWKRYRGGQTTPIWIANLADSSIEAKIPRENSNDSDPMWVGDTIYFLSDRDGPVSLFAYDTKSRGVKEVITNHGFDIKSASAGPGVIVYEQLGSLHLLDLKSGGEKEVAVSIAGDLPEVRPHFEAIKPETIRAAGISPTGARAVFAARGEILTVPAEKGDIRNLTKTPATNELDPAWSPDGKSIAYFSDESGEYELYIRAQSGLGEVRKISLGDPPTFYYSPVWSPDSKKIAYTDKRLNVWFVDVDKKTPVRVDTDTYAGPYNQLNPAWSPDSRWIAYTKQLNNYLHAVFAYSLDQSKSFPLTDGMSDALYAAFDKGGKNLFFTASTDTALSQGWLDMTSLNRPVTRNVYVMVLRSDEPSPIAPESDEEKAEAAKGEKPAAEKDEKEKKKEEPVSVRIDMENIGQRILALPISAGNYQALEAGKTGELFLVEGPPVDLVGEEGPGAKLTVRKFDLKTRKTEQILTGVQSFDLTFSGEKMLYRQEKQWFIRAATVEPPKPGEGGPLKLEGMEVYVDPRAEWRHMFYQVWRDERDFLYDPNLHGVDIAKIEARYAPFLANLASRDDLNYLFTDMLGEITIGHMFVGGGDYPEVKKVSVGLLGADYTTESGRYRFARVFNGENWNPRLRAPLTQPGVNVKVGEYLLAVNGRELHGSDNIYSLFQETAGKQAVLKVGPHPDGSGSREVTVVPVENEIALRNLAWIEDNRRKVDEMTGGRVAYVYLPNTAGAGFTNFNRYYFAQVGKEAAIIDERYNGGGDIADYVIEYLRRPLLSFWTLREGKDITTPIEAIFGPKVMIINEMAGSGGDALPWMFRHTGIGPLIGKRTWGGLVGHYTNPADLIDGGFTGTPNLAFYTTDGAWDVENHGVPPDIEVEYDPKLVRQGHDPQLEKAVEVVLEKLKENPLPTPHRPPYPNYQKAAH